MFCRGCGRHFDGPTPLASQRDPRNYTPQHLADKILQSKSALEGERKQVTVLLADVKGSVELSDQLDPGTLSQHVRRCGESPGLAGTLNTSRVRAHPQRGGPTMLTPTRAPPNF